MNDRTSGRRASQVAGSEVGPRFLGTNPPPAKVAALREKRRGAGQDLYTGEMLTWGDAQDWLRAWAGKSETPTRTRGDTVTPPDTWGLDVAKLITADDTNVEYQLMDGTRVAIAREIYDLQYQQTGRMKKGVEIVVKTLWTKPPEPASQVA